MNTILGLSDRSREEPGTVSFAVPMCNAAEVLPLLFARLTTILNRMPAQNEVMLVK